MKPESRKRLKNILIKIKMNVCIRTQLAVAGSTADKHLYSPADLDEECFRLEHELFKLIEEVELHQDVLVPPSPTNVPT